MKTHKINGLTGLRAIAALWVILYHCTSIFYLSQPFMNNLTDDMNPLVPAVASYGFLGVDLFFILSGFVMSYTYFFAFTSDISLRQWRANYKRYIIFRLARIYPALLFVFFAGSVLLFFHKTIYVKTLSGFLDSLPLMLTMTYTVLATNMNALLTAFWSFNSPLWSVGIEWIAYLFFPFLVIFTAYFNKRYLLLIAFFLLLILQLYIYLDPPMTAHLILKSLSYFIFGLPAVVRISADFFLGYFCYRTYKECKPLINAYYLDIIIALIIGLIVVMINYFHTIETLILVCLSILILCISFNPPMISKFLSSTVMIYLGEISYSIYLVHFLVLQMVVKFMNQYHLFVYLQESEYWKVIAFTSYLFFVVIVAALIYHCIEKPARLLIRKNILSDG